MTTGNIILDILVFLNMYGIYILVCFGPAIYYIWLKIFSFPLITRKNHELLIIITPEKIHIKKIKSRIMPFFKFNRGLYWFSEPFDDVDSKNKYHVFIEGINQSLSDIERRDNKLDELLTYTDKIKSLSSHSILLPKNLKGHMKRHYMITLEPNSKQLKITPVKERQNHRYSFYHSIGFQIQSEEEQIEEMPELENSSSNESKVVFTQLTTQIILQKIKYIQEYNYFSSFSAYTLSRKIKRINSNFYLWLLGTIDARILIVLIAMFGAIALVYFGMPIITPKLGAMPT